MHFKPLILIPSYNTGIRLRPTVTAALEFGYPVWVVVDGSTDGSDRELVDMTGEAATRLTLIHLEKNSGKGAAVYAGARKAAEAGFTHVLTMDSDGQHPAERIPQFIESARTHPQDLIMGNPIFGPDVPYARLQGRKLNIFWTNLETHFCGLGDTLFGMRVYPLTPFLAAMGQTRFARGFDFDPEVAVRMVWLGCRPRQVDAPVRYFKASDGGVSHFNYLRDNAKLTLMHFRLVPEWLLLRQWRLRSNIRRWKAS
jgi:glycosyltransferase involved in cell wall biosynthesis